MIEVRKGSTATFQVRLKHETDATLTYTGSEARTCEVWAGDDRSILFQPTATWVTPPDLLEITIAAADLTSIDPGTYRVRLLLGSATKVVVAEDDLKVLAGPGSATTLPTYCSAEDLRRLFARVESLQDPEDRVGFEEQRALARQWLDSLILKAHRPAGYDPTVKVLASGFGADSTVKGWLDGNKLIVSDDIRQASAHYALSLIFEAQLSADTESKVDYSMLADRHRFRAEQRVGGLVAEIDLNADGIGDVAIPLFGTQAFVG